MLHLLRVKNNTETESIKITLNFIKIIFISLLLHAT